MLGTTNAIQKRGGVWHYDNTLVNLNTALTIPYVKSTDFVMLSFSRFGRAGTFCATASAIINASNGIQITFGTDGTITLVGNGTTGFTATSSFTSMTNVYMSMYEILT